MQEIDIIESQIRQIFAGVVWTHKIQEKQSDIYVKKYNILETTKIVLTSITSVGIISTVFFDEMYVKLLTAIISVILTFITLYFKTYDLKKIKNEHKKSAIELWGMRERIITLLTDTKIRKIKADEIIEKRDEILLELNNIYVKMPDSSNKAVREASKALKINKDNNYSDEEIDSYLPFHLRKDI